MKLRETGERRSSQRLARHTAKLEQQLAESLQCIDKLHQENARLQQQLAAARKNSSPRVMQQAYGKRVRESLWELSAVNHRRDKLNEAGFANKLKAARAEAYFRFITTPGIEPTNNLAEQANRFVVIDRQITQGTRSETGRRWCERIWTTIATQQVRLVFEFLSESVQLHLRGAPPPSLLPLRT